MNKNLLYIAVALGGFYLLSTQKPRVKVSPANASQIGGRSPTGTISDIVNRSAMVTRTANDQLNKGVDSANNIVSLANNSIGALKSIFGGSSPSQGRTVPSRSSSNQTPTVTYDQSTGVISGPGYMYDTNVTDVFGNGALTGDQGSTTISDQPADPNDSGYTGDYSSDFGG